MLNEELHPLLDAVKQTIARSSADMRTPLAKLIRTYESYYLEEAVDHCELIA